MNQFEQLVRNLLDSKDTTRTLAAMRDAVAEQDQLRAAHADTITAARGNYCEPSDDDIEIDDKPAISPSDTGVWVSAWVHVMTEDKTEVGPA